MTDNFKHVKKTLRRKDIYVDIPPGAPAIDFAARAIRHDPDRPLDSGIRRALWLTRAEIAALGDRLRSPLVLLSIDAWLAGQRLPLGTLDSLLDTERHG